MAAPNRWLADGEPGQETWITVLYLQREEGGEREREREREREIERVKAVLILCRGGDQQYKQMQEDY